MTDPGPDPDAIATAVTSVADVTSLAGGVGAQVATFLPGRRVNGVRITSDAVEVHVTVLFGRELPTIADDIRSAVSPLAEGRPVEVYIDDIATIDELGDRVLDAPTPALALPPAQEPIQ